MCTVLLAWRCIPGAPIVVAANRDEFDDRPSRPPAVLVDDPRIVGGRDLRSTGTWFAVASTGRIVTVTNRLTSGGTDPARRSRGELPVKLLTDGQWDAGGALVSRLDTRRYNPFNVLCVSSELAIVGHSDGEGPVQVIELDIGLHVLTLSDIDDPSSAKVAFLANSLSPRVANGADGNDVLAAMEHLLGEHGDDQRCDLDATCVHGIGYGTVSSSSVLVTADGQITYRYAAGPPCVTPFSDVGQLLVGETAGQTHQR